ncbi:Putative Mce family protein [Mycobacteroides abscessus subsp. massiliense]|uniref:MCE family protein n=1 Tax=Mycobacteroides abscessus TaxID=36809 RepID=UPI0009A8F2C0|nr:MCE family protein [Mycobacteroides abscessus]MBN7316583.1 MCE family protein [Mycobacteroides abscessus subsp. massiliense]MDM2643538.1 MCE family protein [Mycobacteroides abscessus]MDM2653340.1 MCE family protein [Mycobacteroides abscessus]MDM2661752.1 MCE family protein [Mycobacteroides abscessus]MDM2669493.1 MCE family protein [Mycobacteroides abscessus]
MSASLSTGTRRTLWIAGALAVVIAVVAGAFGWIYLRDRSHRLTITAQFESVSGLYPDNKVSVLGMPIGKVTKITSRGTYMEVEFTIDSTVKVPADAKAVTVSTSILTDRHIELTPVYRGGPTLKNGDIIGLDRTKTPVEFDRVLAMIDRLSKAMKGDGKGAGPLADLINNSTNALSGNGELMTSSLDELSKALRLSADGGAMTRDQLTKIVTRLSSLFEASARNDQNIREFSSTVRQLSQVLDQEQLGSGTTGKQLNNILLQAGSLLEQNRDAIKQSVGNSSQIAQAVYDNRRELSEGFDLLPLMADNVYNIIDPVNNVVRAHVPADRLLFDTQAAKEICNLMGLRQLGCSTGTLQDYGPDFGLTYVLDGLAAMGQK